MVGFEDVPRIIDRDTALKLPELAVLSTMAHRKLEIATPTLDAISALPADRTKLYFDVIRSVVSSADRQTLEARMRSFFDEDKTVQRLLAQGREQGLEQGREQGAAEGLKRGIERGLEEGLATALRAVVRSKLKVVRPEHRAALETVRSEQAALKLIAVLSKARTAGQVRAMLAAIRAVS